MTDLLTRGGQISAHSWRMRIQTVLNMLKLSMVITFITFCYLIYSQIPLGYVYWNWVWIKAYGYATLANNRELISVTQNNQNYFQTAYTLLKNENIAIIQKQTIDLLQSSLYISIYVMAGTMFLFALYFKLSGKKATQTNIKGGRVSVSFKELRKAVKLHNKLARKTIGKISAFNHSITRVIAFIFRIKKLQDYKIANIPYTYDGEKTHTALIGVTGTGKTVLINSLVEQILNKGDRVIIFDRMRSYTKLFFNENRDVLFNVFDQRCPKWNVFFEARDTPDFDTMATALIPHNPNSADAFWQDAARQLFVSVCRKMFINGEHDNATLLYNLLNAPIEEITKIVQGLPAQNLVSEDTKKMTQSIQAILSTYVKSLEHLPADGTKFSIREWIEDENASGALFLTSSGNHHETLKPLISMLIEICVSSLLSLDQSRERKIWFILDEVASLHNIPNLIAGLTETRQFGGCFVLGIQNYSQLEKTYGHSGAETILSNCRTNILFSQKSEKEADKSSKSIGMVTEETVNESFSFGANTIRDGNSMQKSEKSRPLFTATDIMALKDLEIIISLPQGMPACKTKIKHKRYKAVTFPLIKRTNKTSDPISKNTTNQQSSGGGFNKTPPTEEVNPPVPNPAIEQNNNTTEEIAPTFDNTSNFTDAQEVQNQETHNQNANLPPVKDIVEPKPDTEAVMPVNILPITQSAPQDTNPAYGIPTQATPVKKHTTNYRTYHARKQDEKANIPTVEIKPDTSDTQDKQDTVENADNRWETY